MRRSIGIVALAGCLAVALWGSSALRMRYVSLGLVPAHGSPLLENWFFTRPTPFVGCLRNAHLLKRHQM